MVWFIVKERQMKSIFLQNTKRVISIIALFAILAGALSGCGSHNGENGLTNDDSNYHEDSEAANIQSRLLTDGFWLATPQWNGGYDIDLEYGNDYGFVFREGSDGTYDGTALTCAQHVWKYRLTEDGEIEIYRYYSNEEQYKLMFTGIYFDGWETLNLRFSEDAEEYYETMQSDSVINLSHFPDDGDDKNQLYKKLLFETWSTVNAPSLAQGYSGFASQSAYNDFRNQLYNLDPDVEIYKFYYNYKDFDLSEGNARVLHYDADRESWVYQAHDYALYNDTNKMSLTPYEESTTFATYDENYSQLTLENENKVVYRITNFTD